MQSWLDSVIHYPQPAVKERKVIHYLQTSMVYLSCYASDMLDNPRFLTLLFRFLARFEDLDYQDEKFPELISIYLAQIAHRLVNTRNLNLLNFLKEKKFLRSKKENGVDDDEA